MTLVEVAVSSILVGFVMVAALQAVGQSKLAQRMTADVAIADTLATALVEEVLRLPFCEPGATDTSIGPESGETNSLRQSLDDVDDYHGLSETPPAAIDGSVLAGGDGWTRTVSVVWINPTTRVVSAAPTSLKQVTVTCSRSDLSPRTAVGYKTSAP
jgi:hypothetical protein